AVGTVTDVGAYVLARSYCGTYDQGGNVAEWVESAYPQQRGGTFVQDPWSLGTNHKSGLAPSSEVSFFGFRVSSLTTIGEPANATCVEVGLERSIGMGTWESLAVTSAQLTVAGKVGLPAGAAAEVYRLRIVRSGLVE